MTLLLPGPRRFQGVPDLTLPLELVMDDGISASYVELGSGDLEPSIDFRILQADGVTRVPLGGAQSLSYFLRDRRRARPTITGDVELVDPATAHCRVAFPAPPKAFYFLQVRITWTAEHWTTVPARDEQCVVRIA